MSLVNYMNEKKHSAEEFDFGLVKVELNLFELLV